MRFVVRIGLKSAPVVFAPYASGRRVGSKATAPQAEAHGPYTVHVILADDADPGDEDFAVGEQRRDEAIGGGGGEHEGTREVGYECCDLR